MTQHQPKPKQSIVIGSETALGQQVQAEIIALVQEFEYSEPEVFAIRLAVEEALVNAIKHGNGSDPSKKVRIEYEVNSAEIRIRIEDEGSGFDPDDVPDPTKPEFLERPCGRGLMLMRYYMSEVTYSNRGTCVTMLKRRNESNNGDGDEN